MLFGADEAERLKGKSTRLEAELYMTKKVRFTRIFFMSLSLILLPIQLPIHILLIFIAAFSKHNKSKLIYYYLKIHFTIYFHLSGTEIFRVYPIPKTLPKPSIFFAIRSTNLITPFLQTQFSSEIELPYHKNLASLPIHLLFPILRMGAFVKSFGYPDNPLPNALNNIEQLLSNNKPMVIYINPNIIDPQFSETLLLYENVLDLLDTTIDCFFVKANLIESYKMGTYFHKTPISIYCKPASEVIGQIKSKDNVKIETSTKIMEFFDFKSVRLI